MDAIEEAKKRIETIEAAIRGRKRELRIQEDKLAVAKLNPHTDHRELNEISSKITTVKNEVEKNLPSLLEDAQQQIKDAKKAEKEAEALRQPQADLVPKMKKKSRELLEILKAALKINNELRPMVSAYHQMEEKTGISLDTKGVSSGFSSIESLVHTIEKEVAGEGRDFFRWPSNFPV